MSVSGFAHSYFSLGRPGLTLIGKGALLMLGLGLMGPVHAQSNHENQLIAANLTPGSAQVQGMAGYVLNAETNMNSVYSRKLNREMLPQPNPQPDDGPVIQYKGPLPQVPSVKPLPLIPYRDSP